jgi:flagellin
MALSVNTNTGAMTALQYLSQTQASMSQTQTAISTGYKVSSAKDDGATYAIAQNMRGNVASYSAVSDSLNRGISAVDVAMSAGQSVSDLLIQMKAKALAASDKSIDTASRTALNNDFTALRDQIQTIVDNASFNGYNLIKSGATNITALASAGDSSGTKKITVQAQDLSLGGSNMTGIGTTGNISTQAAASTMVSSVQTALTNVNKSLATLSAGAKKFSIQLSFVSKLSDTISSGIGNLVDANMAEESAKLTSLQTKQQLGVQALSIANSAPSIVLSLFQ